MPGSASSIDPGFGFGKTATHNLELLRRLKEFSSLDLPVLAGWSRKSTLGKLTGRPVDERLAGQPGDGFACFAGRGDNTAGA